MPELKPLKDRLRALSREAEEWKPLWKEISQQIKPTRGWFDNLEPNQARVINHKTMLDGRPSRAARVLAAGLASGLMSPARPWFRLGLADKDLMKFQPVKEWLTDVRNRQLAVFAGSNVYGVGHSDFEELGVFGTGVMFIGEDFRDVIRARNYTAGTYFLGTGHDGRVNAFGREYQMSVGQMVAEFGMDSVSEQVRRLYQDGKVDNWRKIAHLVEENDERVSGYADFRNMAYRSVQWEQGSEGDQKSERPLRASGFEEFPFLGTRWDLTTPSDVYGRGPGTEALGDCKMLQKMQRDKLLLLDKLADPPVSADAGVDGEINTLPGGVSRSSSMTPNAGVRAAYQVDPRLEELRLTINETKRDIDETFYVDLFKLISNEQNIQPRSATEIVEKVGERLTQIGPVLERVESEKLDPLIARTYAIMDRAGMIPPPPEELQGMDITPEYISPLAQAQREVGLSGLRSHVAFVTEMAQTNPAVLDTLDYDAASQEHGEMSGVAPRVIRSPEEVAEIREARAQAEAQAAQAEAMQNAAKAAKDLGAAQLGEGNALEAITETAPAAQGNA